MKALVMFFLSEHAHTHTRLFLIKRPMISHLNFTKGSIGNSISCQLIVQSYVKMSRVSVN